MWRGKTFEYISYDYAANMDYIELAVRCPRTAVRGKHSLIVVFADTHANER